MLALRSSTPAVWLEAVFSDFDAFLLDHAACERKASATGMSLVVKYPDRAELVASMIEFAREELEHFHLVYKVVAERGLTLADDYKDEYVGGLRGQIRGKSEQLLLDRLLVAGVVEARGCERLGMVAEALRERGDSLSELYLELTRAESRHHGLFFRLARRYYPEATVAERAAQLLDFEARLVEQLPHRPRVH